jgi:hypothetical protein
MSQNPKELKAEDIKVFYDRDEIKLIFRDAVTVAGRILKQFDLEATGEDSLQIARDDLMKLTTGLNVALKLVRNLDADVTKIQLASITGLDDHAPGQLSDYFDWFNDPPPDQGGD